MPASAGKGPRVAGLEGGGCHCDDPSNTWRGLHFRLGGQWDCGGCMGTRGNTQPNISEVDGGADGVTSTHTGRSKAVPPPSRHQNIHLQGSGGLSCKNSESQAVLGRCLICSKALVTIDSCNETVLPSPRSPPGTRQARSPDLENLRVKLHNGLRFPCSGREGAALRKARGRGQGSRSVAKHFSS